jgi:hypothetical protein
MTPAEIGHLTDETIRLSVRLGETMGLLTIAMQYAWLDSWVQGCRQATAGIEETLESGRRARPVWSAKACRSKRQRAAFVSCSRRVNTAALSRHVRAARLRRAPLAASAAGAASRLEALP